MSTPTPLSNAAALGQMGPRERPSHTHLRKHERRSRPRESRRTCMSPDGGSAAHSDLDKGVRGRSWARGGSTAAMNSREGRAAVGRARR
jgi:hypothetical protein